MKPPPLLLGTSLAFWGWHTGLWWLGLGLGLVAELPRLLSWRWELEVPERERVADLCTLLVVLAGIYLYFTQPRLGSAVIVLLQWFPVLLFPLLAVQLYGGRGGVELSALVLSLRGGRPGGEEQVDLVPPYFLICLLAAAMVPPGGHLYYPSLALFAGWALWPFRTRAGRSRPWVGALVLAVGLGHAIGLGLQQAQQGLEDWVVGWLVGWAGDGGDPYRTNTAIGEVGRLKQSERIVLRVRPGRPLTAPLLLRTAAYNRYAQGTWWARRFRFGPVPQKDQVWRLAPPDPASLRVGIETELVAGRGLLPLPAGGRTVHGLEGARLSRNRYGVVKVLEGPPLARYRVDYAAAVDVPPEAADLRVPSAEAAVLSRMPAALGLEGLPAGAMLQRLQALFGREFRYSLRLETPPRGGSALAHFLLNSRAGHCEYFATAAALLLRQAGIPTRYVRGWSVQEYSDLEHAYVARSRHAHAWVLAWVDGAWREFDPTPAEWARLEARERPWWGTAQDLWARALYLLRYGEASGEGQRTWLGWLLPPLALLLAWRIGRRGRRRSRAVAAERGRPAPRSPFAEVEAALARRGAGRRPGETLREWVRRLEREGDPAGPQLEPAVDLYYRERFAPGGLAAREARRLGTIIEQTLRARR